MLTLQELKDLGYDFKISGRQYEVTFSPRITVGIDLAANFRVAAKQALSQWWNNQFDAYKYAVLTGRSTSQPPALQNIPRQHGKNASLAAAYSGKSAKLWSVDDFAASEVICKSTIEQAYQRKGRATYPQHVNIKQIEEICIKAANFHYVKRQLTQ